MYMPSFAKDLLRKTEPVPEKTLTRKWIEHLAKQVGLVDEAAMKQTDSTLLNMVSEKVEVLQVDLKEFNELKLAVKTVERFQSRLGERVFYPRIK
jgi:hypothetical protein